MGGSRGGVVEEGGGGCLRPRDLPEGLSMSYLEPLHVIDKNVVIPRGNFSIGHPVQRSGP